MKIKNIQVVTSASGLVPRKLKAPKKRPKVNINVDRRLSSIANRKK